MKNVKSFSKITKKFEELGIPKVEVPNLIQAQIDSFDNFLQKEVHPRERADIGLQSVFNTIFPIKDVKGYYKLEFVDYVILKEKYDTEECIERNLTYNAPIRAKMRLVIYDEEALKQLKEERIKSVVEQDVYLGNIPLITNQGTFIINGAERVIISQLHRSPGVFLTEEETTTGVKKPYSAKIIPSKGSWLEFACDVHDVIYVCIDNRRKLPATVFLRCLGFATNDILRKTFYDTETIKVADAIDRYLVEDIFAPVAASMPVSEALNSYLAEDVFAAEGDEVSIKNALKRTIYEDIFIDAPQNVTIRSAVGKVLYEDVYADCTETIPVKDAAGKTLAESVYGSIDTTAASKTKKTSDKPKTTQKLLVKAKTELTKDQITTLKTAKINEVVVLGKKLVTKANTLVSEEVRQVFLNEKIKKVSVITKELVVKAKTLVNSDIKEILIDKQIDTIKVVSQKVVAKANTLIDEELQGIFYDGNIEKVTVMSQQIVAEANTQVSDELIEELLALKIDKVMVVHQDSEPNRRLLENTIAKDSTKDQSTAVQKLFALIKPNEDITDEAALAFINRIFFDEKRYSLGEVGRYKVNKRLGLDIPLDHLVLTSDDIKAIIFKLIEIYKDEDQIDDIDHLSNRRVRTIGELMEEQYHIGLTRVAKTASDRLSIANSNEVTVHEVINPNALTGVVNSFFLTGQLSQFMEQTNPLAAIKHKRALSALGPGGISRDRAGFEVRDVHYSHYGRICPIETPEGPNIGLIVSPALYSKLNKYGFLVTPYIKVVKGKVLSEVEYLDPLEEDEFIIAQANKNIDKKRLLTDELIFARYKDEYIQARPNEVQYMDVTPQQIVSVSAALIPFLEHDDANRALMGSNMQRQSVPLLYPEAPIVGTGLEKIVAHDAGICAVAPYDGVVENVTSSYIDIRPIHTSDDEIELSTSKRIYLKKFLRSNQDTCINQKPIVKIGEKVQKNDLISDGPCIENNRLALGRNLIVAFMPWYGFNYEDAIILNENVAREDILTSIYIEVHEVMVRNTKNGKEELAYDIPNVPTYSARNLDKTGIIRVGSAIKNNDIIVGKITPKSADVDPSPEETLMRALFGDRAGDFSNTSLKAKPGMEGVVIDVKVFSRYEDTVDYEEEKKEDINRIKREHDENISRIDDFLMKKLSAMLLGETSDQIIDDKGNQFIAPGKKITKELIKKINFKKLNLEVSLIKNADKYKAIYSDVVRKVKTALEETDNIYKKKRERYKHGDELPYGVIKMIKVFIAKKRKVQVGDKMAGRHGNKGVISKICPIEDMPFMADGTPVDIILNPLGVPSRMNIGQIMETHLGMAAKTLGYIVETPV
ncbi:MAG: DNA-directed RNA polymerase subunit beta, partial [Candidatus Cloacimonetes bacterium]|nr:DNA-directed RNA polymerase subunit beta [Candidatus Cloacimonadota bacterium]